MKKMKIEDHLKKISAMEKTLEKLDRETDYEAVVELCMLVSAHHINAALHKLMVTLPDRDIKHNKLAGEIKRRKVEGLLGISDAVNGLEQLRPRHVYGRGSNGDVAKRAVNSLEKVKKTCIQVLG